MNCQAPGCRREARTQGTLCWGHVKRKQNGQPLTPLGIPRNPGRRGITPERLELYRRISEESKTGRSLFDQAEALGISHGQLKHLRVKAYVYGFEVAPVSDENRRGVKYDTAKRDAEAAAAVPRCPRCWLALPCNGCLPSIADLASSRRGDSGGLTT